MVRSVQGDRPGARRGRKSSPFRFPVFRSNGLRSFIPLGRFMHLSELKTQHVSQLLEMATSNEIDGANRMRKQELIFALLKNRAKKGESIFGEGTLEVLPDGFGFLRSPDTSY